MNEMETYEQTEHQKKKKKIKELVCPDNARIS